MLALACLPIGAVAASRSDLPPPEDLALSHDILRELVQIDTTHAQGSTAAAQVIQQQLLKSGFPAEDVVFVAPPDKPTKGNVVVRYRGKGGTPVLFMGHLDVVDARREDWSTNPFLLVEKDGYFYGRGTIDMKDGDAALMEALIRLKRERYVPSRDIIVAFTADEEAGGDANGPAYLLRAHRDLIDAGLAINLDGGGGALRAGRPLFFAVGTSEKVYVTYTLETTSPGGHGSLPGPENAIYQLAEGLGRIKAYQFPVLTTETTRANFLAMSQVESGQAAADLAAVARQPPDPAAAQRLSEVVRWNAQLRTTCVATLISGGHAENALPQRARATIQCRMMPSDTAQAVEQALVHALDDPGIHLSLDAPPIASPDSPPSPQILAKAARVVHSMWPKVPLVPIMSTGFSDDRQTRGAGIPTYDLSGVWSEVDENRAHGRDERVGVAQFDQSVEYTYRLMKAFGR